MTAADTSASDVELLDRVQRVGGQHLGADGVTILQRLPPEDLDGDLGGLVQEPGHSAGLGGHLLEGLGAVKILRPGQEPDPLSFEGVFHDGDFSCP